MPGSLELGVWPTFAADPEQSADVQAVLAAVSTLSIGARTLPLFERWDQLSGATGSPRALTWTRWDAMAQPFIDRDADIALCVGVVDRFEPAWPFASELDTTAATAAIERTVDEVFTHFAPHLSHLCFGYELDRYFGAASGAEQARLLGFLQHAVDYASHHPLRTDKTVIGTAVTLDALGPGHAASLDALTLGDEVVAVYDPLDAKAKLKKPESVAAEVTGALDALAARPGRLRPLTLFEVGYPSATLVGSSEQLQQRYYDSLLGVLDARASELGFVGFNGLADRADSDCALEAPAFVASQATAEVRAWATARCAMGLRAERDKLAYASVSAALSRYR